MVREFRIIFDHSLARDTVVSVLSGSELSGKVIVKIDEPKRYDSIKILLIGEASKEFREIQMAVDAVEKYADFVKVLWDKSQSPGPDHVLPAGEYCFPFQFSLPSSLPSSFEWGRYWIRYYLEAVILAQSHKPKHTVTVPVQITEVVDINTPELNNPLQVEKQSIFSCLSCVSGFVMATVRVPRTGYCIGEGIPLHVTVVNASSRQVKCLAKLSMLHEHSVSHHKQHSGTVFSDTPKSRSIDSHRTRTWAPKEDTLIVPMDTPVSITVNVIKRYFHLNVIIVIPNAKDLVITIPVTIGNVPHNSGDQDCTYISSLI